MLKLFEVMGFKNFKDRITLDFSDVRDYKFNPACITNHLIGKMIVYTQLLINQILLRVFAIGVVYCIFTKYKNIVELCIVRWGIHIEIIVIQIGRYIF